MKFDVIRLVALSMIFGVAWSNTLPEMRNVMGMNTPILLMLITGFLIVVQMILIDSYKEE